MANDSIFEGLDPKVAAVLNEARRTSPVEPDPGLIAAMTAAAVDGPLPVHSVPRRKTMIGKLITAKALAVAGALVLTGGMAAAATGTLPDVVQDPVSNAVDNVGINIPEANHGSKVSDAAHDKEVEGKNHGDDVSGVARDNHGHATTTTIEGDDNSGPGNSGDHRQDGEHRNSGDDDDATTSTTVDDDSTTSTTIDDHGNGNRGRSGEHTDAPETEPGHGGHGGDD